jgi:hypothetical protein
MMIRTKFVMFALLLGASAVTAAENSEDAVKIPLDTIWASGMPGTIDVWKIEDTTTAREIIAIQRALSKPRAKGKVAESAFVVLGTGQEAIHEAHAVLVDGKKARKILPQGSQASIVFFSYEYGQYVHLRDVFRDKNRVTIQFEFIPHETKDISAHFAIIPLPECHSENMQVEIVQLSKAQAFVEQGFKQVGVETSQKIVCRPFSFTCERVAATQVPDHKN